MKINQKRAKSSSINTGVAILAGVAAFTAAKTIAEKMPDNKFAKFAPHAVMVASIALPGLDILPNTDIVNSALLGAGVISGLSVATQLTAGEDGAEPTGIKATIRKYVPQLSGVTTLGSLYEYNEAYSPSNLLNGGENAYQEQSPFPNVLGNLSMDTASLAKLVA